MKTQITAGIKITVLTDYQANYSRPSQDHYVFTYKIIIENCSNHTIQLLKRYWKIYDAYCLTREVEGEGVVGKKPILEPGQIHQYVSGCNLSTGIGKMKGVYLMEKIMNGKTFDVKIPEFTLTAPFLLN